MNLESLTQYTVRVFLSLISVFFLHRNHNHCESKAVEESSTGAIISFPEIFDGDLFNVTWEVEPAAFGYADYGGTLEAFLALPLNKTYHTECKLEPDSKNSYIHYINDYLGSDTLWILVIDRGDCYFATKVYNAQRMGAAGVIMLDYKQEGFIIMWEPDDFEHDIDIPSVMLKESKAELLMSHLGVKNWNPKNIVNMTYPEPMGESVLSNNSFQLTKALIEWGLPHDDDRVEWEIFTSSNDDRTIEFKRNFKWTSIYLNDENYTLFTPHYYILNGSHWNCDNGKMKCKNQCSNSGRYCAVDPEGDLDYGISGIDVVQEDLRQLCIWNFTTFGDPRIHNESVWWDYSVLWNDYCFNDTNNELLFNANCSYRQMGILEEKGVTGLREYVDYCINASGGYGYEDGINTMLDYEVKFRETESIHVLPTFRVNEFMIYGEVDCEVITEQECSIFDSICSGFIDGTQPDICYATPAPTPLNCSDSYRDCAGICYGSNKIDRCDNCLDPSDDDYNSCVGCDNVTNSIMQWNDCGYCLDSTSDDFDTYGTDCRGAGHCDTGNWGIDKCDQCLWIADTDWDSCVGCDGVANSNATWHCGLCLTPDSDEWDLACEEGSTTSNNNSESMAISTVALLIGGVAFVIICLAACVIYKLYKKQQDQSKAFENILKTYNLMDENPSHKNINQSENVSEGRKTKKKERVPATDELEVEDEDQVV